MKKKEKASSRAVKIGFIGGGRMAEALIQGLKTSKIIVSDIQKNRLEYLKDNFGAKVTQDNQECADFADVVILAVKPQMMREALKNLKLKSGKLIISIAAGIKLSYLQSIFVGNPVVRVMPNNPALVGKGVSAITYGELVEKKDKDIADKIFKSVGDVVEVLENQMDAVTGLSGSGPAFVYMFIHAMIEAGERSGLKKETAQKLAVETVLGSCETLLKTGKSPQELVEMVASPGGTTLAGISVLEARNFKQAVIDAVAAATGRAAELSKEWI